MLKKVYTVYRIFTIPKGTTDSAGRKKQNQKACEQTKGLTLIKTVCVCLIATFYLSMFFLHSLKSLVLCRLSRNFTQE